MPHSKISVQVLKFAHPIYKEFLVINITVRKLGGAAFVVIPEEVLEALHIGVGSKLDFDVSGGVLVVRPAAKSRCYPIAELLQGQVSVC
ncbi:MAG: hypothetical protein FD134_943 [Gallionellaceae bacterium]|jgi:antitoxin component of MazEF toxin-antitoxin module|nr:MAG: hypothetical protein FD134_943 [Gallionellaceae bacterium]